MVDRRYGAAAAVVLLGLLSGACASGVHRPLPYCSEGAERRPINPTQWPGVRTAAQPPAQRPVMAPPAPVVVAPSPPPAPPAAFPAPAAAVPAMPPAVDVEPAPSVAPAVPAAPATDRWKGIWRPADQSSLTPDAAGGVGVCNG